MRWCMPSSLFIVRPWDRPWRRDEWESASEGRDQREHSENNYVGHRIPRADVLKQTSQQTRARQRAGDANDQADHYELR